MFTYWGNENVSIKKIEKEWPMRLKKKNQVSVGGQKLLEEYVLMEKE